MIRILDPTLGTAPTPAALPLAPRPAGLSGATLGLLANGKSNGMALLDRIAAHLREHHGVGEIVRVAKTNASAPVSEEDAELLAKRCAAVVTAVGD
jgi:hypothetical protein